MIFATRLVYDALVHFTEHLRVKLKKREHLNGGFYHVLSFIFIYRIVYIYISCDIMCIAALQDVRLIIRI